MWSFRLECILANVKNNVTALDTQRRLLEAAGEVFAERGYHLATIKEITDRAGASLASVNYHFRDKAELYAALIRRIETDVADVVPPDDALHGSPSDRFRQFVRHLVGRILSRNSPKWKRILMARELAQPSAPFYSMIDNVMGPIGAKLAALAEEVSARPLDEAERALVTSSILGQCLYHVQHQAVIERLYPAVSIQADVSRVADFIADFSLAGIRAHTLRPQTTPAKRPVAFPDPFHGTTPSEARPGRGRDGGCPPPGAARARILRYLTSPFRMDAHTLKRASNPNTWCRGCSLYRL